MKYFDKENNEITKDKWYELSLTPKYQSISFDSNENTEIKTSWCGVGLQSENPYKLFLSEVRFSKSKENIETLESHWTYSLEEAKEFHKEMIKKYLPKKTK